MIIKQSSVGQWRISKDTMYSLESVDVVAIRRARKEAYSSITLAVINAINALHRFSVSCKELETQIKLIHKIKIKDGRVI